MWLTRLGTYLFTRILKDGRDERFAQIKTNIISFLGAWTLQALWIFLIDLPVLILNSYTDNSSLSIFDAIAWSLWVFGFFYEVLADA